ncbi:Ras association domain protein [Dictyocaulus viviparus]|uniref:Ras association domain protein n=1 Tax=Dictyocaulus viviparus TaxID=29172 RepID=A0A0D8XGW0_DICVI|nr:Ras association domain protein [Dictyocaulus viviparus]
MELKVTVDGIERSISGVSNETTCAQVIYALAHATGQKGRYIMIEKFRNKERRLSPVDRPFKLLEKWHENKSNVTFELKKIDEEDANTTFSKQTMNSSCTSVILPPSKLSEMNTVLPQQISKPLDRNRPPPPDYNSVMEQKFASLGRSGSQKTSLVYQNDDISIAEMSLSHNDLLILIEKQRNIIERQRKNLLESELTLPSEADRELFQLQRQYENLQNILTPIRWSDWPKQYQKQLKQSHKLSAAIEATKEAIDKTMSDVEKMHLEEVELQKKLSELSDSSSIPSRANDPLPMNSSNSSPSLKAF